MTMGEKAKAALKLKREEDAGVLAANLRKNKLKAGQTSKHVQQRAQTRMNIRKSDAAMKGMVKSRKASAAAKIAKKSSIFGRAARVLSKFKLSAGAEGALEATDKLINFRKDAKKAKADREKEIKRRKES
jgi:hypothetical protein